MKKYLTIISLIDIFLIPKQGKSQINEDLLGAWYMYFYNTTFKESPWGIQGDVQYRNWNLGGNLEQLLIRSGVTYKPKNTNIKFTVGYGNINSGSFDSDEITSKESRIYQEALYPVKFGNRIYTNHRFRYEQRFTESSNIRTRYRYNFFINIPLNNKSLDKNTVYISLYNELFINGQKNIGNGNSVEIFDRNRFYTAIGYIINTKLKTQLGIMKQSTNNWSKNQIQLSLHHKL